jgi:aminoglycoside 3-N-acetyltransferase I
METQIKRLGKEDVAIARRLLLLFGEVFEMGDVEIPEEAYLEKLIGNPGFIMYAAISGNEVAGGLTAYALPMYYTDRAEMFIYDIAVRPAFQRKGVGGRLLSALQRYCKENGIREMFVAANEEDAHAVDFYRKTGGREEKVLHFTYRIDGTVHK